MSKFADWINKTFFAKKIRFLGPKHAGKTQMLFSLGAKELTPGVESNREKYNTFCIDFGNEKVFIKKYEDSNGGDFKFYFKKYIHDGNFVFYLFDMEKFDSNYSCVDPVSSKQILYREQVLSNLSYIKENISEKYHNKIRIIPTHVDLLDKSVQELIEEFIKYRGNKLYTLANVIYPIDARDTVACKNVIKKTFQL